MNKREFIKKYAHWAFFPISILFCEIWLRVFSGAQFFNWGLVIVFLFSLFFGLFAQFISCNKNAALITIQSVLSVWYCVQTVYHNRFSSYMYLSSLLGAGQIAEIPMLGEAISVIIKSLWQIAVLFIPLVVLVVGIKKFKTRPKSNKRELSVTAAITVSVLIFTLILRSVVPYYRNRNMGFEINGRVSYNGLLYTEFLDFCFNFLGVSPLYIPDSNNESKYLSRGSKTSKYGKNVMNIDFKTLANQETDETVKALHEYFDGIQPTNKNKYTGMFEGYNLIQVTAEGFSYLAIDKELTPTLYKMQNEGFKFNNFYTPLWGVSTSDGEYIATTGLIPKGGVWSYYISGKEDVFFPFSMPQQFLNSGLKIVRAYHNHTYTYYNRDISHKNIGFSYKGIGNGLEKVVNSKLWPESDNEMIKGTTSEYIGNDRFMTYYMTVSGHSDYTKGDNYFVDHNWDRVAHLPYSDMVKGYLATQLALEDAMTYLVEQLEQAGIADDTVICLTTDHDPYGLDKEYQEELFGFPIKNKFDKDHSCLIMWCGELEDQEPIVVDTPTSVLDILPTLSNLFGTEFDSRLMPGRDVFSDAPVLVFNSGYDWKTEYGTYISSSGEFHPVSEDVEIPEEYVATVKKIVRNKIRYCQLVLETDYFRSLFPNG